MEPVILSFNIITSSTAQGGGGSFQNRKPIREVGCCDNKLPFDIGIPKS